MKRIRGREILMTCLVCTGLLAFATFFALAEDAEYVGAKKCKFCHNEITDRSFCGRCGKSQT